MPKKKGFTLVELIVVILLVGIMASYAASRYLGKGSFSAYTYSEAVVSVIRQVQVNRMQSNVEDPEGNSYFTLYIKSGDFNARPPILPCVGSKYACDNQEDASRSDSVLLDESSGLIFSASRPSVEFDLLGNPVGGVLEINIIEGGSTIIQVCINSQGYVYTGGCS
ncbi:type II secretion system protein [Vibrio astriarenae]|uniref:type II secretion system protein n=1 Tax=Vibrio astriarenae TaxID=1481923 RepID=UPI00373595C3